MSDVNTKINNFAKQVGKDLQANDITDRRQDEMIGDISKLKTTKRVSAVEAINELADRTEGYDEAPDFVAQFLLALQ